MKEKMYIQKFYSNKVFIFLPAFYLIIWLMKPPKNFEKISILKIWQLFSFWGIKTHFGKLFIPKMMHFQAWNHFFGPCHTQTTNFAFMNQYFNDKLSLFLTEVSFNTSEENQLSYFQNGYFFKILWGCHEPYNQVKCR